MPVDFTSLSISHRKQKDVMKALETPEEKRARRVGKKEAKERTRREKMGWDKEYLVREGGGGEGRGGEGRGGEEGGREGGRRKEGREGGWVRRCCWLSLPGHLTHLGGRVGVCDWLSLSGPSSYSS